ncbi:MAG: branched-chain amino acid ABC transporter permease [Sutterellaceae bacterium]|nr:branched-chain amino acid ABC transporter permease [Burkholderiaceae bacterium]MDW8429799.1 branched-chain amino acid ABC transporter permease [Sutterellaceae bacterium]
MPLLDALLTGITLGGMYALVALGLNLQYGVARIMNLSYGEVVIAAAIVAYVLFGRQALSPLLTMVLLVPLSVLLGWAVYRFALAPLVRRAGSSREALEVDSLLGTFGLLFVVQGIMLVTMGGSYLSYSYLSVPVHLLGTTVAANRLLALALAVIIGVAIWLLLTRTRIGTAIRALSVDPMAAQLVAIPVQRLALAAFALGTALAATAGVLISMFLTFSATMGVIFTMKALIVVIMGGIGNMAGAVVAALLLGLVEAVVGTLIDPALTLAANYALFLAVLLFKPAGLFGRAAR